MEDKLNEPKRGPLGDARPGKDTVPTEGGKKAEPVEDRPSVGTVRPEDYPKEQRVKGDPDG